MTKAQLKKWWKNTSPSEKGITSKKRKNRKALRAFVYREAGTTAGSMRVGVCRDCLGDDLVARVEAAIKKYNAGV